MYRPLRSQPDPGAELATRSDIELLRTYMATTVGAMTALTAIFGVIVTIVV